MVRQWRSVAWYDAEELLRPLALMAANAANLDTLHRAGLVHVLADLI